MKRYVCAVMDRATMLYGSPIFVAALGAAVRSFVDEVGRDAPDNSLSKHPEDFELWVLAMFDDEEGSFELPPDGARVLVRGKEAAVKKETP